MRLSKYIIESDRNIIQAMEKIDKNSIGTVYVVSSKKVIGVITDGDIRRFILEKGDINSNVLEIVNTEFQFSFEKDYKIAKKIMNTYKIRSIPVLNFNHEIVGIYCNDEYIENEKNELNVPVVIMAGGKGTRLYPYTQILPKPLIPIGDKTITEHIIGRFMEYGCSEFIMVVNYKKHFIKSYFRDSEKKLDITFAEEEDFLGTAGGLKLLDEKVDTTFFMTNCDILIDEDYSKILNYHRKHNNMITMVCAIKKMEIPYGIVEILYDDKVVGIKEKPEFSFITNTGFYVIEPEFLKMIPENTFIHITDVIQQCIEREKNVGVYKISEDKWLDMGQLEELERMREKLNLS